MISRYGNSVKQHIAGEFKNETKLSNNGEKITLIGNSKQIIHSIDYSDDLPWPVGSDGEGYVRLVYCISMDLCLKLNDRLNQLLP